MNSPYHPHDFSGPSHLDWISTQVGAVLDPLARRYRGWPVESVRPIVARAWRREFCSTLPEPGLTDTAAAIRDGRSWYHALWTGGW